MTSYIAAGSNLGNRKKNIISAYNSLQKKGYNVVAVSPLYETPPALLYQNAEEEWNTPYLNCVFKIESKNDPFLLLQDLKKIETSLKRGFHEKWAPRTIDLDIIEHNNIKLKSEILNIPHSLYLTRSFVLDPLSWFKKIPPRFLYSKTHQPLLMGIINATPNSFSERTSTVEICKKKISMWLRHNIQIIDIGGEASNPSVSPIDEETEQNRIIEILKHISFVKKQNIFSKFSIDTYHYRTAEIALNYGFDIINDIHGFDDMNMLSLAKEHPNKNFIFMHNKDIRSLPLNKTISSIQNWFEKKMEIFSKTNIPLNQFIFDPGIGFGKTANQSILILQHITKFQKNGIRLLIGHSRKSFMNIFSKRTASNRDLETIAFSQAISNNIDMLRVHTPIEHQRILLASSYSQNQFY